MQCRRCGSHNLNISPVTEVTTKHRGCLGWFFWIILVMCTFGLVIIIPLITNSKTKSKTHNQATCQNCGYSWRV